MIKKRWYSTYKKNVGIWQIYLEVYVNGKGHVVSHTVNDYTLSQVISKQDLIRYIKDTMVDKMGRYLLK